MFFSYDISSTAQFYKKYCVYTNDLKIGFSNTDLISELQSYTLNSYLLFRLPLLTLRN